MLVLLLSRCLRLSLVVTTALATRRGGAYGRPCTGVVGDYLADNRSARCAASTGASRCTGFRRRSRCRRRWSFGRIKSRLLHRPLMTFVFVFLLLVSRLAFGRIDVLLRQRSRREQRTTGNKRCN